MNKTVLPIAAVAFLTAYLVPFRPVVVSGRSMAPTLSDHQVLVGRSDFGELRRGDVVVVDTPEGTAIKRIAFLPGDRVPEYFSEDEWVVPTSRAQGKSMLAGMAARREFIVPEGQVFVIGDNVDHSIDSRHYGPLSLSSVRLRIEGVGDKVTPVPGSRFAGIEAVRRDA